jgi:hypothetical protein
MTRLRLKESRIMGQPRPRADRKRIAPRRLIGRNRRTDPVSRAQLENVPMKRHSNELGAVGSSGGAIAGGSIGDTVATAPDSNRAIRIVLPLVTAALYTRGN